MITSRPSKAPGPLSTTSTATLRNTNPGITSTVKNSPRSVKKSVNSSGSVDKQPRSVTTTQSVPFLQRKFNLFGGGSSSSTSSALTRTTTGSSAINSNNQANERLTRSSIRGSGKCQTTRVNSAAKPSVSVTAQGKTASVGKTSAKEVKGKSEEASEGFKGVQSLKQFWNSRISSSGTKTTPQSAPVAKSKIRRVDSVRKTPEEKKKTPTPAPVKTGDDETAKRQSPSPSVTLRQSSSSFAKSDNFNKYKTASSVKQLHRVSYSDLGRNSSTRGSSRQTKRHTVDSVCIPRTTTPVASKQSPSKAAPAEVAPAPVSHNRSTLKFPQIATTAGGAKIHWPKREDILLDKSRRRSQEVPATAAVVIMIKETESNEILGNTLPTKTEEKIVLKPEEPEKKESKMEVTEDQSKVEGRLKPEEELSQKEEAKTEDSVQSSRSATPSSMSVTSTSRTDSPRKTGSTRKASFKTHSGQSQSIRKLVVGSKVAALTHRFNQLVQTDAAIMEEVKRKGVLVHRMNGHVYKIKEDPATVAAAPGEEGKRKSLSRTSSIADGAGNGKPGLKRRKSSVKKHDPLRKTASNGSPTTSSASEKKGVKATIELFEPNRTSTKRSLIKPKVPDKSEQVLRRTKELVTTKREFREDPPSRMSLKLDEIKEVLEEKTLTPIQEALPAIPQSPPPSTAPKLVQPSEAEKNGTLKKDKSVYGRIYEKLKINKSSFLYSKKSSTIPNSPATPTIHISNPVLNSSTYDLRDPIELGSTSPVEITSEQKIFEALEKIDKRIEDLHKNSLEFCDPKDNEDLSSSAQNLQPNQSFLFRSTCSTTSKSPVPKCHQSSFDLAEPCAALNVGLIKSKTMSMDERNFPFVCLASDSSDQLLSVSTSDLQVVSLGDDPANASAANYVTRNEYQEIINETDKLIRRMNEAYGAAGETEEASPGTHHKEELAAVNSPLPAVKTENNYDLYEQIAADAAAQAEGVDQQLGGRDAVNGPGVTHSPRDEEEEDDEESIYQTVTEVKTAIRQGVVTDEASVNSYESCGNYEAIDELRRTYREEQQRLNGSAIGTRSSAENGGYEICEPPEPPPPRKISANQTEPPQIPVPKRNKGPLAPVPQSTFYTPTPGTGLAEETKTRSNGSDIFHSENVYEENIYDTIKSADNTSLLSNNYESISLIRGTVGLDKSKMSGADTISFTSNCYESLRGSTLTINHLASAGHKFGKSDYYHGLRHSESVSTLSSDHKTNSIYGTTMHYGGSIATNPGDRHSIAGTSMTGSGGSPMGSESDVYTKMKHPPSENGTSYSENSDEWVDITDGEEEEEGAKHKLIVVRERVKNHRSTTSDWNAKIREQRIHQIQQQQQQQHECYDDDSGHHYESMYSGNYEGRSQSNPQAAPAPPNLDIMPFDDDDFDDSFESDIDEEDVKKNDSGVDVSNTRLPDPPSSSNQVNSLVQKTLKTIGLSEITKSLHRFATKKRSKHHHGESAANLYHPGPSKNKGGKQKEERQSNSQFYANMDFHTSVTPALITSTPTTKGESGTTSSPGNATTNSSFTEYTGVAFQQMPLPLPRKKSKNGKSFKSKLRRSLVPDTSNLSAFGSSNCNKSTFYVNGDSPDMDSGIFTGSDKTLKMEDNNNSSSSINKDNNSFTDIVNEIKTRNAKNNRNSSTEDVRRRSIATSRPLSPPPAPPVIIKENGNTGVRPQSTTSWYDECGVFKPDPAKEFEKKAASMTNWYADSGLYQTSGDSVTSSSGSSGVSTGGECNGQDDHSHSMFSNEPLYQIYSAAKLESITRDIELDTDGYEEIGKRPELEEICKKPLRPTALQLVSPQKGPSRTLWSEIPEVINSEILSTLTPTEKRIQEAKFEIITSEASYLKSLNLLKSHFMNHPAFRDVNVLSAADRKTLFSYTIPVLNCSEKLLTDLENCWQDNIMLIGLSSSIYKHAESSFKVYVNYCEHQVRLDRILKKLKETNKKFCEVLEQLELNPICCGLSFHSFLMLPMQRITRLPLLIDAVLSKLQPDDDEYENWKVTLAMLNKIVAQCNEAAHKCEQVYEMQYISRQIEFPSDISPLPIVPVGIPAPNSRRRALVRRGEMTHLIWRGDDGKLTFGKKFSKSSVYVFLFTDLLVLTKRKSDDTYLVFDYCCRSMLTVSSGDVIPQLPTKDVAMAGKHLILMTLLENHQGKTVELILSCESETDRTRWLKATEPPSSENPDETLYEQWDCPQVTVLHAYQAKQPDELSLDVGDVVNVTRKMADGWYHGERIRDGEQGWFPGNYTEEVASPHVRARNLKQRYRLLTFTANYLESQKKK